MDKMGGKKSRERDGKGRRRKSGPVSSVGGHFAEGNLLLPIAFSSALCDVFPRFSQPKKVKGFRAALPRPRLRLGPLRRHRVTGRANGMRPPAARRGVA